MKFDTSTLRTLTSIFSGGYDYMDVTMDEKGWDIWAMALDKTHMMTARIAGAPAEDGSDVYGRFEIKVKDLSETLKAMGVTTEAYLDRNIARLCVRSEGLQVVLPLPMASRSDRRMPNLRLTAGFMCDMSPFRKVVGMSKAAIMRLRLDRDGLELSSMDESGCGPRMSVPAQDLQSCEGEACAGYGTVVLKDFLDKFPKGAEASVEFGDGLPLKVSFAVDGVEGMYMLAPMIEEDLRCRG